MNWPFVVAGCLSLLGCVVHGGVGDRIVRRIDNEQLPGNPFTGITTRLLIRVTWHFTTIAFLVLGVGLVAIGIAPDRPEARGVAYLAGAAFACWAMFALIAGFARAGARAFFSHPGPIVFVVTVVLIVVGTARL